MRASLFQRALERSKDALDRMPHLFVLQSVITQLEYLVALENGLETDLEPVKTMDFGMIAVRDLWQADEDLAELLSRAAVHAENLLEYRCTPQEMNPDGSERPTAAEKDDSGGKEE